MKRIILIVLVLCSSVALVTGVTYAQASNTTNPQNNIEENDNVVREISDNVVLREINFDFDNETVHMTFDSSSSETIVITDALITESRTTALNRQQYVIDGKTTVHFEAEQYNNKMAITIDGDRLYPFMESDSLIDFTNNYTPQQLGVSILFGMFMGTGVVTMATYRREMKLSDKVEKIT